MPLSLQGHRTDIPSLGRQWGNSHAPLTHLDVGVLLCCWQDGSRIGQLVTRDSRKVAASLASLLVEKRDSLGKRGAQ